MLLTKAHKKILYTKNTYTIKLILNVVTASLEALEWGIRCTLVSCQKSLPPVNSATFLHLP
jgi:hypothetical protein